MRRWLSSTSRCGLYVFRWPTYTDIYWLVLTFLSCNFAEPRMVRKRSIDPASNFHREGEGEEGLYWKTRPLCRRSPSFPNFLLDSLLCPTINPFLSSFFFFLFFHKLNTISLFRNSKRMNEMVDWNWSFDGFIFFSFRFNI